MWSSSSCPSLTTSKREVCEERTAHEGCGAPSPALPLSLSGGTTSDRPGFCLLKSSSDLDLLPLSWRMSQPWEGFWTLRHSREIKASGPLCHHKSCIEFSVLSLNLGNYLNLSTQLSRSVGGFLTACYNSSRGRLLWFFVWFVWFFVGFVREVFPNCYFGMILSYPTKVKKNPLY